MRGATRRILERDDDRGRGLLCSKVNGRLTCRASQTSIHASRTVDTAAPACALWKSPRLLCWYLVAQPFTAEPPSLIVHAVTDRV